MKNRGRVTVILRSSPLVILRSEATKNLPSREENGSRSFASLRMTREKGTLRMTGNEGTLRMTGERRTLGITEGRPDHV
jgi:hypothetical protein